MAETSFEEELQALVDLATASTGVGICPFNHRLLRAAHEREMAGLRKMISCEEYDGTEANKCAEDTPDPPDRMLHRCLTCQIAFWRERAQAVGVKERG